MWLPEILFVYLWGKVAGLSSAKNKGYEKFRLYSY